MGCKGPIPTTVQRQAEAFRKGTSVVEGSIEIGMNEGIKKDTMIAFVGVALRFFDGGGGDGLREVGQALRSGL